MSLRMTPDAPSKAIPIATFWINAIPSSICFTEPFMVSNTPPAMIIRTDMIRITIMRSLIIAPISLGKALICVVSPSFVCLLVCIQFQTKGTSVLSLIPLHLFSHHAILKSPVKVSIPKIIQKSRCINFFIIFRKIKAYY